MAGAKDQTLPSKEATLFRQVVKCYESKQYKKGIKAADQVKHCVLQYVFSTSWYSCFFLRQGSEPHALKALS